LTGLTRLIRSLALMTVIKNLGRHTDFKSSYHTILGRPMLAKFMAIPHYTYFVLKMPAPNGVHTVYADLMVSFKYDNEALDKATMNICVDASVVMVAEVAKVSAPASPSQSRSALTPPSTPCRRQRRSASALSTQTRRWSSVTTSGRNRNSRSPVSSGITPTYSHGPHRICRVFQASWLSNPWM
jgi:chitodextrinase